MLLLSLCDFAFKLLLGVKGVQLCIDLFFEHALLNLAPLVNELLLAFDLRTHNVELRVFLSQSIVAHLKLLVELALDESLAFILAIGFQLLQALVHVLADLLRGLLFIVELLFVHAVFSGEKHGKFLAALLQVGGVLSADVSESAFDDLLLDDFVGLVFPLRGQGKILVSGDVRGQLLHFLNKKVIGARPLTNSFSRRA